jgi:hypothetical protein
MKTAYKVLAFLIALEVVVQAAVIAWGVFGLMTWVDEGHSFTEDIADCEDCFDAQLGIVIHSVNGFIVISVLALIFLIVSFFAKIPGGVKWAVITFVLVILQGHLLPGLASEVGSGFGAVHGLNAMVLFGVAVMAGKRVKTATGAESEVPAAA